jgi:two-component system, cell cycle sensor histidine kinase and response regulator CckA
VSTPLRVLIVEDLEDDAALILRELRRGGYTPQAERVETAAAMTEALGKKTWDIVISDNTLPRFTASEALKLLQATRLDIPIIIVSGSIGEDTAVSLMKSGAHDYVFKGNLARLPAAVERELREAEGRRARRQADAALRAQQELLRTVIDANPNRIFVKDWDGRFTLANQTVAAIYGTTPEALLGKTDAELNPNRAASDAALQDDREVMESGRSKFIAEETVTDLAGQPRWFQTVKVPIAGRDGTRRHVLGVATDITERKQLEEQFRQAQKMEAVGRLAGGVAHDFNNLLTAILGSADLVLDGLGPGGAEREEVEEIRKAALRAADLTRQLLAFSRQQVFTPTVLSLNDVVANMNKLLRRLLGEDVELRTALAEDLASVKADPNQLEQVILNLAVNARDAMPGGGRLTIETQNIELDEAYARRHLAGQQGPHVLLAVSDTGVGMDAETQTRIFEPFFTTKETGKGTGLGLATVYGIVRQSGGSIFVYSEPGKGATFKVYLPRVTEAVAPVAPAPAAPASVRGTETVLVVEDDATIRNIVRKVLTAQGYAVLTASDGHDAERVASAHAGAIDLLVTDVVMPGLNGRQVAERLVAKRKGLRVLYLSGYTDDAIVNHGVLDPGVAFLQKPFTPTVLARKVREVLESPPPT